MTKFDDSIATLNGKLDSLKKQADANAQNSVPVDVAAAAVDAAGVKVDAIAAELPAVPTS